MAKKILIGTVVIGATRYYAGTLLDESAEADAIAAVVAAGGQLLDQGDPVVDAAALTAQQRLRDGQWQDVDRVMLAAVAKSAHTAAPGGGGSGPQRDLFIFLQQSESTLTTCLENAAAAGAFNFGEGSRNGIVVFPAGWDGGDLVWSGTFRGEAVVETFLSPGAGGGTVTGEQLFTTVSGIANAAPGGTGAQSAEIQLGRRVAATRGGLSMVEKVTVGGVAKTPAATDLVEGWVEMGEVIVLGDAFEIVSVIA